MAKFKNQDLILDDNEQALFGDDDDASIYWDGSDLIVNQVFKHSTQGYYATRAFVEQTVAGLEWQDSVLSKTTSIPEPGNYGDRYIVPAPSGVYFDPNNKEVTITLSNNNLTATGTVGPNWETAMCDTGVSSGKWYFELTFDVEVYKGGGAAYDFAFGVANSSHNNDTFIGADANGWSLLDPLSIGYFAGTPTSVLFGGASPDIEVNDVVGIALNMDNGKIWWSLNGVWGDGGDPASDTSEQASGLTGTLYPGVSLYGNGSQVTLNFGESSFSYSVPTGFQALINVNAGSYTTDDIVEYTTTWTSTTPSAGFSCWVEDEGVYYIYNGSTWIKFGGVVDHGNLLGLSDDDHTQYVLADGSRALSSDWDAGANKISCTGITARSASAVYLRRNAADLGILINTDGQTSIESTCFFQGDAYLGDNKRLTFGAGYDNTIVYSTTTDTLQVLDGNVTNTNVIAHFSSNGLWLTTGNATFSNDVSAVGNVSASAFYGDGSGVTGSDHGSLTGLSDDDHTIYYHVDGRRSWSGTLTVESTGSIITFKEDLAYIGVLNDTDLLTLSPGDVYIDGDLTITGTLSGDHSTLFNLDADDHTQYHNDTRGDARYYTQTQLNNGQLDSRYYTETELNNGQLDSRYYTEAETLSLTQGASANAYNNAVDYTDTEIATVTSLTLEASANAYDAATDWVTAQSYLQSIVTDTSPQLGGNLDLNGKNIDYGAILSTNGTYEGKIMTVTVDDASSAFGLVLAQAADFHYDRADADAATSSVGIVMALESGSGSKSVLIEGQICDTSWSWSAGFLYVSTAIGEMTQTPPSGTGDQVIAIGWALSATCIYFKPSLVLVEIA